MDEVMADTMGAMFEWYYKSYKQPLEYSKMKGSWMLGIPEEHKSAARELLYSEGFFATFL